MRRRPRPRRPACPTGCARRPPRRARHRRGARPPLRDPPWWPAGSRGRGRRRNGRRPPPAIRRPRAGPPSPRRCRARRRSTTAIGLTTATATAPTAGASAPTRAASQVVHELVEERTALVDARTRGIAQHAVGRYRPHPFGAETGQQRGDRLGAAGLGQVQAHRPQGRWPTAMTSRSARRARPPPGVAARQTRTSSPSAVRALLRRRPVPPRCRRGRSRAPRRRRSAGPSARARRAGRPGPRGRPAACPGIRRARRWPRRTTAGATVTPAQRAASPAHTAAAIRVSVSSGRCGPCCSSEPKRDRQHRAPPGRLHLGPGGAGEIHGSGAGRRAEADADRRRHRERRPVPVHL